MLTEATRADLVAAAFRAGGATFVELAGRAEVGAAWEEPSALAGYTVGGIVGHVTKALAWLEPMLEAAPPDDLRPIRLGNYYSGMKAEEPGRAPSPVHDVVRDMSEAAARHGWAAGVERFGALIGRLDAALAAEPADRLLDMRPLVPAAVRLGDFVCTRVVELVVHADDLAVSVGIQPQPPAPEAASVAIDTMLATARSAHGDLSVLRALARRERSDGQAFPVF